MRYRGFCFVRRGAARWGRDAAEQAWAADEADERQLKEDKGDEETKTSHFRLRKFSRCRRSPGRLQQEKLDGTAPVPRTGASRPRHGGCNRIEHRMSEVVRRRARDGDLSGELVVWPR